MFASGKSVSSGEIADPYFNNVPLLLTTTTAASDGSTNAVFLDSSSNNQTITRNGTPTQGTFSPFGNSAGAWSMYFDGSTYLNFTTLNAYLTTGPCTVEAWVNFSDFSTSPIIVHNYNWNMGNNCGWSLSVGTDGRVSFGGSNGVWNTGVTVVQTTTALTVSRWYHVAFVRDAANLCKIYINGVDGGGSGTYSASFSQNVGTSFRGTEFGRLVADGGTYNQTYGFISNFRIVNGTAVYTGNFNPPDPLTNVVNTTLLFANSATPKDNSSNNYAYTVSGTQRVSKYHPFKKSSYNPTLHGGSVYFVGSASDYLSVPDSALVNLTSGSYTVEAWAYPTARTATYTSWIVGKRNTGAPYTWAFVLGINASGYPAFGNDVGGVTSSVLAPLNAWTHIAAVSNGTTVTLYVNGVATAGPTAYTVPSTTAAVTIGSYPVDNPYFSGYISNIRIVKGTAVYTGNFTPSTAPVTNIANTSLLCDFTNGAIIDYATVNNGYLLADARAKIVSPTAKFGSTAMAFDGSGDYLVIPSNPNLSLGTANATVEFWMYSTAQDSYRRIVTSSIGAFTNNTFIIRYNNGTFIAGAAGSPVTASALPSLNAWNHIAWVCVNGTTQTLYVNGVNVGTATLTYSPTEIIQYIGGYYNVGPSEYFSGYIQDLRITKGNARYTSNFTAPTTTLTSDGNTVLLLNTADNNYIGNSQNNTFRDSSSNNFAITRTGTPTQGAITPYTPTGYWSGYFNGSSDYLTVPANAAFAFGTGDFTMEAWIYPTAFSADKVIVNSYTTWATTVNFYLGVRAGTPNILIFRGGNSIPINLNGNTPLLTNTWYHVAVVRSSGVTTMYVNGVAQTVTHTGSVDIYSSSRNIVIGRDDPDASEYFSGYISNLRLIKGTPVYTSAFTPPSAPLTAITNTSLLTLQDNRFKDNSATPLTITPVSTVSVKPFQPFTAPTYSAATYGGSGYFGTTDYLTAPNNAAFVVGTGNFTVECWCYLTTLNSQYNFIFTMYDGTNEMSLRIGSSGAGSRAEAAFGPSVVGSVYSNASYPSSAMQNQWVHLALCRNGDSTTFYYNGAVVQTRTGTSAISFGTPTYVNINYASPNYFLGYISNLRFVKGTAVYTSAFTPPTTPLTAIANTSLLTNFTNAGIYDASAQNVLTTIGDAGTATLVSRFGSTSMYFDGTGDYVSLPYNAADNYGTGDLTIECWFYPNGTQGAGANFLSYTNGSAYGLIIHSNLTAYPNVVTMWCDTYGAGPFITGTTTLNKNTWYHFALTRASGVWRMFINGTLQGSTYTNAATPDRGYDLRVGGDNNSAGRAFTGHIQDFKITRGVARYTSNFTIPTTLSSRS